MGNRIYSLLPAATGTAISMTLMGVQPAQAASLIYDFTVDVTSGPLVGNQYTGSFTYDDNALGNGLEPFFEVDTFNFQFANRTYTETDLVVPRPLKINGGEVIVGPSGTPIVTAKGGVLEFFNFTSDPTARPFFFLFGRENPVTLASFVYGMEMDPSGGQLGEGTLTFAAVPEPGSMLGIGAAIGFGWLLKFRSRQKHSQS